MFISHSKTECKRHPPFPWENTWHFIQALPLDHPGNRISCCYTNFDTELTDPLGNPFSLPFMCRCRGHCHCHHVTSDEIIFCSFYLHNNGSSAFFLRRRYAINIFVALHVGRLKSDSSNVYILLIYICNLTFAKQVFAYSLFRFSFF